MYKLQKLDFIKKGLRLREIKNNLEWCLNNYENICIADKKERSKYREVIKYLLNIKVKNKVWTEEEVKMMIMFFSKDFSYKLEIDNKIEFEIRADDPNDPNVYGRCISKKSQHHLIVYYEKMINLFIKKSKFPVLPLQIIFHEIVHAMQSEVVDKILPYEENKRYNLQIYMITLENMLKKIDKDFYDTNYKKVYKEKNADKVGLYYAMVYLKKYIPESYKKHDKNKINKTFQEYDIDYYNTYIECLGSTENYFETMDVLVKTAIIKNKKILDKYPVLKLGYNEDGTNKNIIELIEQRKILLQNQSSEEIDELFEVLINKKNYGQNYDETFKMEVSLLLKYIEETKTQDKFVYNLLKYRIKKIKEKESSNKEILYDLKECGSPKQL